MENTTNECPICYQEIIEKCTTPCQHAFCKSCIINVLKAGNFVCPYCRGVINGHLVKLENGDPLAELPTTIFGQVFIQGDTEGLASYHFNSEDDCYISYESPECVMWPSLSDGSRPPSRKPFDHAAYNENTRTFTGIINWSPINWEGDAIWIYTMVFPEDFSSIPHGTIVCLDENKEFVRTDFFGQDLNYRRITKELDEL